MNTVPASLNTTVRQATEMFLLQILFK